MGIQHQKSSYLRAITYVPIRHHSTGVENIRQIRLFMQIKPNFPHFSPENEDCAKKQTQFKPNSNPILAQKSGWQSQTNPIQSQFWANFMGEQTQTNPKVCPERSRMGQFYPRVYPRVLLTRLAAGECELTCFGVYPRVCLPVFLPGVGGKPGLTCPSVYRKFTIKKLSNYKQTFNIHPFLIDNSIVYALYGHICSFISRKWRRYFNAN